MKHLTLNGQAQKKRKRKKDFVSGEQIRHKNLHFSEDIL